MRTIVTKALQLTPEATNDMCRWMAELGAISNDFIRFESFHIAVYINPENTPVIDVPILLSWQKEPESSENKTQALGIIVWLDNNCPADWRECKFAYGSM